MMNDFVVAFGFALLMWWLSTGFILFLNHLHPGTYRWSLSIVSLMVVGALIGIRSGSVETSQVAAFVGFAQALIIWAWLEMSYFMGLVTGPRKRPCPPDAFGWRRFHLALQTSLYHELAVIACGALIIGLSWGAPNQVAAGTFVTLWLMRWSAKLNLFLGVPNVNTEWFPRPLQFLCSYMPVRPMNLLFPFAVSAATIAVGLLFFAAGSTADAFLRTAYALVGSLLALAVLEHWFLVLPLRDSRLWNWALRLAGQDAPAAKTSAGPPVAARPGDPATRPAALDSRRHTPGVAMPRHPGFAAQGAEGARNCTVLGQTSAP
jgi:putative photosynthetic complex assembly protein 2